MAALWVRSLTDTRRCATLEEALVAHDDGYRYMSDTAYAAWLSRVLEELFA
jgi:hypothetical protein